MKLQIVKYLICLSILVLQYNVHAQSWYYYGTERLDLTENPNKVLIKKTEQFDISNLWDIIKSDKKIVLNKDAIDEKNPFIIIESTDSISISIIDKITDIKEVVSVQTMYEYKGNLCGITDEFVVKLTTNCSIDEFRNLLNLYSCRVIKATDYVANQFLISVLKSSKQNALQLANLFFETGLFEYSEPNFFMVNIFQSNDYFYTNQWSLKNVGQGDGSIGADINIEPAWDITEGSPSIRVAIVDEGVDLLHPDLVENLEEGYDATGNGTAGGYLLNNECHGTACAGIIAATKDNNIGIAGVAPRCHMVPIHASYGYSATLQNLTDAIYWAVSPTGGKADIINNSWGGGNPYSPLTNAINFATTEGRDGLGTPLLFASGNDHSAEVSYPANLQNTIAVGAASNKDKRELYSNYGIDLEIIAPGGNTNIYTTDITGTFGYSNTDYTSRFDGTSAACPHAAGVMALILSVNPCLTVAEAREILCKSCDKLPDYKYCNSTYGFWNNEVGYGKINAYKAVLMALGLTYENHVVGNVGQSSSHNLFLSNSGCTGLPSVSYSVQRYDVTKTITFPYMENPIIEVSTNGYSAASPNSGNNYYNIANITHTSADVKTWKYKIITNNGEQTFIPNDDVYFKYIVFDATVPTVYVTNKTVDNTSYNSTAIERLNISNFIVQNNSNVELRAGDEIVFEPTTTIRPTSTGIVHAKAAPFVSCENSVNMQSITSPSSYNRNELKAFKEEHTSVSIIKGDEIIPVLLFPNPAENEITIRCNKEIGEQGLTITINNSSGKVMKEIKTKEKDCHIDLSSFMNGIYIVKVKNQENCYSKIFIKK